MLSSNYAIFIYLFFLLRVIYKSLESNGIGEGWVDLAQLKVISLDAIC